MKIIDKKLFIVLFFAFILATVLGTVSHECGHYLVAKCLGFKAKISYAATSFEPANKNEIETAKADFYIILGGPLQTLLTGTFGCIFLLINKKLFYKKEQLLYWQWLLIYLSIFWIRQTTNFLILLAQYFFSGKISKNGDEAKIAAYLNLPHWSILFITGFIGMLILAMIIFKFIPMKQRFTFMASGLAGGIAGFILWFVLVGKYILP